jgi:formate dehydrogenase iron-sulfur subunit
LLREAHRRISAHPGRYIDHVYGETEVGGTSLLILSDIPLEQLGYPAGVTDVVVPSLTGAALRSVPKIAFLGGALLVGLFWLTQRRNEVLARQTTQPEPEESVEKGGE